jgi:hypothetical protein
LPSLEDTFANTWNPKGYFRGDRGLGAFLGGLLFDDEAMRKRREQTAQVVPADEKVMQGFPVPAPTSVPGLLMDLAGTLPGPENVLLATPAWARRGGLGKLGMLRMLVKEAQELATPKGLQDAKIANKAEVYHATDLSGFKGILDAGEIRPNPYLHQGLGKKKQAELMKAQKPTTKKTQPIKGGTPVIPSTDDWWGVYNDADSTHSFFYSSADKDKYIAGLKVPADKLVVTKAPKNPFQLSAELTHLAEQVDAAPNEAAKQVLFGKIDALQSMENWLEATHPLWADAPKTLPVDQIPPHLLDTPARVGVSVSRVPRIAPKAEKAITFVIDKEKMPKNRPLAEPGYQKTQRETVNDPWYNLASGKEQATYDLLQDDYLGADTSELQAITSAKLQEYKKSLVAKYGTGGENPPNKRFEYEDRTFGQPIPLGAVKEVIVDKSALRPGQSLEDIFAKAAQHNLPVTVYSSGPQMQFRRAGSLGRPAENFSFGAWERKKPKTSSTDAALGAFGVGQGKKVSVPDKSLFDKEFGGETFNGVEDYAPVPGTTLFKNTKSGNVITTPEYEELYHWAETNSAADQWTTGLTEKTPDGIWEPDYAGWDDPDFSPSGLSPSQTSLTTKAVNLAKEVFGLGKGLPKLESHGAIEVFDPKSGVTQGWTNSEEVAKKYWDAYGWDYNILAE